MQSITGYDFRLATPDDLDRVIDFYNLILKETHYFAPFGFEFNPVIYLDEKRKNYIVVKGSKIISFVTIAEINSYTLSLGYATHPEHRGKGIAKNTVEQIISWARENGYKHIHATAHRDNWKSIILLHDTGFKASNDEDILRFELNL